MLIVLQLCLSLNIWDSAKNGHWFWFTGSLVEFWVLGGILFWMGVEKFNEIQRRRRVAQKG